VSMRDAMERLVSPFHRIACCLFDLKLAAWMLDPDGGGDDDDFVDHKDDERTVEGCADPQIKRAALSCLSRLRAGALYRKKLREAGTLSAFEKIEAPHGVLLDEMRVNGMQVDLAALARMKTALLGALERLQRDAFRLAGRRFSLSSPYEVSRILFGELQLRDKAEDDEEEVVRVERKLRKQAKRFRSTSREVLEALCDQHPLPRKIIDWRQVHHALYQNLLPLEQHLSGSHLFRARSFHLTCTGRVLMAEPNVQNLPRAFRTGDGDEFNMREIFVAADDGVLVSADYAQLELRLMAHFSADPALLRIFNEDKDADIFRKLAASLKESDDEGEVSDAERQSAKQMCYGMLYGMGAAGLARHMSTSRHRAQSFIDAFHRAFPALRSWLDRTAEACRRAGHVTTLAGRRRGLPDARSDRASVRAQAERRAVNSTVQGSAADVVKRATLLVRDRLVAQGYAVTRDDSCGKRCLYVNHMHDELVFETRRSDLPRVVPLIRSAMQSAFSHLLRVALVVKVKSGTSWGSLQPFATSSLPP
ncbi:MAG: DNA polymerase A family protein, partial [Planctomycetota bacterium]